MAVRLGASDAVSAHRAWWRRPIGVALLVVLVIGCACAAWAFVLEPRRLVVHRETLRVPSMPTLRLAVLSDLHAGAHFIDVAKIRTIVTTINEAQPDVVLLLGDYLNNGAHHETTRPGKGGFLLPEVVAPELGRLRAKYGVFAVLGNHDWWFDGERITRALTAQSIVVLENRATSIALASGQTVWLAGIADATTRSPEVATTLATIPAGAPVIVLTHNPDIFPDVPARVTLTLAGHTHGGQVALPFIGRPIVPSEPRYAAGHVIENERHLFVTTGVGTSLLPVRFGVPPEVVLLSFE